jgi:hypothetical protein
MSDAHRLVRTLLRDERAVSEALQFDVDTTSRLRERLDDLLETITEVARDDDL